ncbi:MAG: GNAT family N-acetyltransferase [Alphaproteobacteria bacterium]
MLWTVMDHIRRIESLTLNAWPALDQVAHDGWLLRYAEGYTGRANSVTVLQPGAEALEEKIPACENTYAEVGAPCRFRLSPLADDGLDAALEARGYVREKETVVLSCDALQPEDADPRISLTETPHGGWLETFARAQGLTAGERRLHEKILERIALPRTFALFHLEGEGVCTALTVLDRDAAMLLGVAVDARFRGQGFGHRTVRAALGRAYEQGARAAHLGVEADNREALTLYEGLGFTETYRYHYRRQAGP